MIPLNVLRYGIAFSVVFVLAAFGSANARADTDDSDGNIVASVTKAPVSPDGTVSGRPSELVINLDTSLDPNVPGRTLLVGRTIKVTLPDAFTSDGRPIHLFPCDILNSCNSLALLQGWPQNPIPSPTYALSYEGANTIVITAVANIGPISTQNPGLKQIHLIIRGFTNPSPGDYPVRVRAETGPGGMLETGVGLVHILSHARPNLNVVSATPDNPPPRVNKIYQETSPGMLTPRPIDFLVWDGNSEPFIGVEVAVRNSHVDSSEAEGNPDEGEFLLVQGDKVVGHVSIDAPDDATGQAVFTQTPSSAFKAPVTGIPSALLRIFFRAGSATGHYVVTFTLNGGNSAQMFVRVK